MATYTTRNRLIKQTYNENIDTWGTFENTKDDITDAALDGITSLALTGATYTLTSNNNAADEARPRRIKIASAAVACTVTIPSVEKWYLVENASAQIVSFKTAAGAAFPVNVGEKLLMTCDGSAVSYHSNNNTWRYISDTTLPVGPSGSTNASWTVDMNAYKELLFVIENMSHNNGAPQDYIVSVNGTNYSMALTAASTVAFSGEIRIERFPNMTRAAMYNRWYVTAGAGATVQTFHSIAAVPTTIALQVGSPSIYFDSGTVRLFGR